MSYKPDRTGGRCGCIAALPVMFAMLMLFIVTMVGDCHIDAGEAQCAAAERDAALILILTPLSGIAAFLLINWLVGRRK